MTPDSAQGGGTLRVELFRVYAELGQNGAIDVVASDNNLPQNFIDAMSAVIVDAITAWSDGTKL